MKIQATPVTGAIAALLFGLAASAQAQTPAPSSDAKLEAVVVTGIRASQQKSLTQKKNAESHVDVITAEDIGKMPDKNIADSLQRVPGITISSAGANEGGFDENDRVSMRGTNPSLTQTLINGHNLASGDWFVLNQTTNAGRSVSYTLLPSEIVGSVVVHKTSEASLVEGRDVLLGQLPDLVGGGGAGAELGAHGVGTSNELFVGRDVGGRRTARKVGGFHLHRSSRRGFGRDCRPN